MLDIKGAFEWCLKNWSFSLFVLSWFVQITPAIKFNPWTALFRWIGKVITADVMKAIGKIEGEIVTIKSDIADQQDTIDANECDRIRWEILDFANSCRNHRKHTKDEFEHIIDLNTKYEALIEKTGKKNGVYTAEYRYIYGLYEKCQRENTFLGGMVNGGEQ